MAESILPFTGQKRSSKSTTYASLKKELRWIYFERTMKLLIDNLMEGLITMNHTPTPWTQDDRRILDPQGRQIAVCHSDFIGNVSGAQDAAHIVKSVNAHDELVAALRSAEQAIVHGIACAQTLYEDFSVRMESFNARAVQNSLDQLNAELAQARAALAKVQS